MAEIPFEEAVAILRQMLAEPSRVSSPAWVARLGSRQRLQIGWSGEVAEIVVQVDVGMVSSIDSIRIGARMTFAEEWDGESAGNPHDELSNGEVDDFEQMVLSAAARA